MLLQILGAGVAIFFFAFLLETPKKYIWFTAITGALGGAAYLLSLAVGMTDVFAYFFSAFLVTVCSNIFAKILKTPVTVFLIAGIIPTVPGAGVYNLAYSVIIGDADLSLFYLLETLKFAGTISLGIFVAETIFRVIMRELIYRKSRLL
ncbi:MAG: threonine/serine exporter family protein [Eubacteriales bacterium]